MKDTGLRFGHGSKTKLLGSGGVGNEGMRLGIPIIHEHEGLGLIGYRFLQI